jgi:hypothetical protein
MATLTAEVNQVAPACRRRAVHPRRGRSMFLSLRTIHFGLRNVFAKTGVSSRGELAHVQLS